jgi:hypothetical protein
MAIFVAMNCLTVNDGFILCREDREAGMETALSPKAINALVPITFYDVKDLSMEGVAHFMYGDNEKQAPIRTAPKMQGCIVVTTGSNYYFEFPCKEFRKLLQ